MLKTLYFYHKGPIEVVIDDIEPNVLEKIYHNDQKNILSNARCIMPQPKIIIF